MTTHRAKLRRQGKSTTTVVTLKRDILRDAGLSLGDEVGITVREDGVIEMRLLKGEDADAQRGLDWALRRYAHALGELAK